MAKHNYSLGRKISSRYEGTLEWCLINEVNRFGWALEFGVASGESLVEIAKFMDVVGFDSFQGLPEDWRPGFEAGSFAVEGSVDEHMRRIKKKAEDFMSTVVLRDGWFEDSLPAFISSKTKIRENVIMNNIDLVHVDCDIYSSTKTIFDHIGPYLFPGTVIVFDEWHGYSTGNPEDHEQKAFKEFVADHPNFNWQVIGHGPQQWAIRVTTDITGAFK